MFPMRPFYIWYSRQESNLRLLPPEGSALSTELREQSPIKDNNKTRAAFQF